MSLPSELSFASLWRYAPQGTTPESIRSRNFCYAIKNDSYVSVRRGEGTVVPMRAVEFFAKHLKRAVSLPEFAFLGEYFGPGTILVPIPRSAPQKDPKGLWPTKELCKAMVAEGLAADMMPLLERIEVVPKSAGAKSGPERPGPQRHFDSTRVIPSLPLFRGRKLVLVDDVVTRGSTFIGMHARLRAVVPDVEIKCFAAVRTLSRQEVEGILDPVQGTIRFVGGQLRREP
jgi:hypothetical protein